MKYLPPLLLLLLAGLANAGEEPKEDPKKEQMYMYILMNGEQHRIRAFRSQHSSLEDCERAIEAAKHKGHTRAIMVCGTALEGDKRRLWVTRNPKG